MRDPRHGAGLLLSAGCGSGGTRTVTRTTTTRGRDVSSGTPADGHMLAAPSLTEDAAPNLAPPPGNPRFPLFDALRAVAALSVFLGHTITGPSTASTSPSAAVPLRRADLPNQGVALFFLISGFLLYRPFLVARRRGSGGALSLKELRPAPAAPDRPRLLGGTQRRLLPGVARYHGG